MLLVWCVAFYFVVIMGGVILPWWVWVDWWSGGNTVDVNTVVAVACIAWVLGFWTWLRGLGDESSE